MLIGMLPDQRKSRPAVVAVVSTLHLQMVQTQWSTLRLSRAS